MGKYPKKLFELLVKKIGSEPGVYSSIRRKEEKFRAVKSEILFYLVAVEHGIKISKYEKNEEILKKVDELLSRNTISSVKKESNNTQNETTKILEDPFVLPLSKFNLFVDLAKECKVKKPFSKEISHALLNLEVFMRNKMGLDDSYYGKGLVEEAKKQGVFKRKIASEEEGLYFLYRSAFQWLRNGGAHRKRSSEKEECFKLILFTDYLIKLFEELYENNVKTKN